jgi:hypothetical protein
MPGQSSGQTTLLCNQLQLFTIPKGFSKTNDDFEASQIRPGRSIWQVAEPDGCRLARRKPDHNHCHWLRSGLG